MLFFTRHTKYEDVLENVRWEWYEGDDEAADDDEELIPLVKSMAMKLWIESKGTRGALASLNIVPMSLLYSVKKGALTLHIDQWMRNNLYRTNTMDFAKSSLNPIIESLISTYDHEGIEGVFSVDVMHLLTKNSNISPIINRASKQREASTIIWTILWPLRQTDTIDLARLILHRIVQESTTRSKLHPVLVAGFAKLCMCRGMNHMSCTCGYAYHDDLTRLWFEEALQECHAAATKIQKAWRRAIADPCYSICRIRLLREFDDIKML